MNTSNIKFQMENFFINAHARQAAGPLINDTPPPPQTHPGRIPRANARDVRERRDPSPRYSPRRLIPT